jgi:hypothetical protein
LLEDACEATCRFEEPKKLTLRTDFTDYHVSLEVENNGGCVTSVEHMLEAVVADESRGTVVTLAISRSSSRRKGARSKLFDEKEEGHVFASSYLASTHRKPQFHDRLEFRSHAITAKIDIETSNRLGFALWDLTAFRLQSSSQRSALD